jgi:hypothetical protein
MKTPDISVETSGIAGGQRSILDKELKDAGQPHLIPQVDVLVAKVRAEGGKVCQVRVSHGPSAAHREQEREKMPHETTHARSMHIFACSLLRLFPLLTRPRSLHTCAHALMASAHLPLLAIADNPIILPSCLPLR